MAQRIFTVCNKSTTELEFYRKGKRIEMENQDFLHSGTVNSVLPISGQQQGNLFSSDLLQPYAPSLNQSGSFSHQIKAGIAEIETKPVEYAQGFPESILGKSPSDVASTTNSEFPVSLDNSDSLIGDVTSVNGEAILDLAVTTAKEQLETFVSDEEFIDKMNLAFGNSWQPQEANALIQDLATGEAMPKIEILPAANLNANGAFGEGTIYLSENFLSENITNPKAVSSVLLEEVGHYLDRELNSVDSAGDEGNIFAKLVQGETITGTELKALKSEDDSAIISFNGEKSAVELAEKKGKTGFFTFDAKYYLSLYPDLKNAFGDNYAAAEQHWLDYGIKEGRRSSPVFDVKYYLDTNPDLKNAFGDNYDAAVQHWLDYGMKEGRRGSVDFAAPPQFPGKLLKYEPELPLTYDENVKNWQQRMKDLGKDIDVDGLYGPQSAQIASNFQQEKGLAVDGIVGLETWEATFGTEAVTSSQLPFPGKLLKYEPESALTYDENVKNWQQRMKDLGKDIDVDGLYGPQSAQVARNFQQEKGLAVDGIVGPETWEASFSSPTGSTPYDATEIINSSAVEPEIREYAKTSVPLILSKAEESKVTDPGQIAYILASADHESLLGKYLEELASGEEYEGRESLGNTQPGDGPRFKGRGYVQLTGRSNYTNWSQRLGVDLVGNPELAADPNIAATILVQGMRDGSFTGVGLSNYISGENRDFVNARRIVNGLDRAEKIAEDAERYYQVLTT
jgi:peptidoglycan hydrolase-like protein with peptidoglycan-binding domain